MTFWLIDPVYLGKIIAVQRLHDFTQTLMRVILLVPHILVILDLSLFIKSQGDERIGSFCEMKELWCVCLLKLEDDAIGL